MTAKDAIRAALNTSTILVTAFTGDLNDEEILIRPVPGANHIAWQLGHIILAENRYLANLDGDPINLPAGFEDRHTPAAARTDPPSGFSAKAVYLDLFSQVRTAFLKALDDTPDDALDEEVDSPLKSFAPTRGAIFILGANHATMHAGQFAVLRRKLGKPILF